LGYIDNREGALNASQEAVQINQQLAADRPAVFNPDLARFLNNLSNCLSGLGQKEEVLKAIQEAV